MGKPTVPFCVDIDKPPELSESRNETSVTASFIVRNTDVQLFIGQAMGRFATTPPPGVVINAYIDGPWRCPLNPNLLCVSASARPKGGIIEPFLPDSARDETYDFGLTPGQIWDNWQVTLTWGFPDQVHEQEDDPEGYHQFDPENPVTRCKCSASTRSEYVDCNVGEYVWDGTTTPVPIKTKRRITIVEYVLDFPDIPYLPVKILEGYIDSVNSVRVFGVDPGYLLYTGLNTNWQAGKSGRPVHDVSLKFEKRSIKWNEMIDPVTGTTRTPVRKVGGFKLFEAKDHRKIFYRVI